MIGWDIKKLLNKGIWLVDVEVEVIFLSCVFSDSWGEI